MKLALISNTSGCKWAGSEVVWHLAALRALKAGHSVVAFLHPDLLASEHVASFRAAGGEVRTWQALPVARLQRIKEAFAPTFPGAMLDGFDSILVSLGSLPAVCYVPGLAEGLLSCHAPCILFGQFNAAHLPISVSERRIVSQLMEKSAACAFVSAANWRTARHQFAVEPRQVSILANPIREMRQEPLPWPDSRSGVSFACVARFETAWKGQDMLLDVLSQPIWRQRNWVLRLYGAGPDIDHLRKLTSFLKLDEQVHFEGFQSDLSAIWATNHALLLPSYGEGTPLAALEAMMFGRPVICTDVGGNREIVQDGVEGFIAEGATSFSLGAALNRAWEQRDAWHKMGLAAHRRACAIGSADPTGQLLRLWLGAAKPETSRTGASENPAMTHGV
jgi:L-malate glycosyltransferase